jgi:hypothetical protein
VAAAGIWFFPSTEEVGSITDLMPARHGFLHTKSFSLVPEFGKLLAIPFAGDLFEEFPLWTDFG